MWERSLLNKKSLFLDLESPFIEIRRERTSLNNHDEEILTKDFDINNFTRKHNKVVSFIILSTNKIKNIHIITD